MTSIGAYLPVYTYDTENRIKNIDNGVVDFAYDSEGRQIRRTFLGTSTYYLYGLTGLISEFTTTNTGASQARSTDRLRYELSEQTGTAVLFVSPSGSLVESNRVYPYGEKLITAPATIRSSRPIRARTTTTPMKWTTPWRGTTSTAMPRS